MLLHVLHVSDRSHGIAWAKRVDEVGVQQLLVKYLAQASRRDGHMLRLMLTSGAEILLNKRGHVRLSWLALSAIRSRVASAGQENRPSSRGRARCIFSLSPSLSSCTGITPTYTSWTKNNAFSVRSTSGYLVKISGGERRGQSEDQPRRHQQSVGPVLDCIEVPRVSQTSQGRQLHGLGLGDRACCREGSKATRTGAKMIQGSGSTT